MKHSIVYRKLIVLTLATVLLVFGLQGVSFGQLSAAEIKDDSSNYVVWIVTEKGSSGSGVLIDKVYRRIVTNAHVVKDYKEVNVFFAVRDSSGKIVRARPFYINEDHQNTLQRLGYVTRGRIIAKYQYRENEPDLAIIELDSLPATANPRELLSIDYSKMKEDEQVHILGHPAGRPLWHSTLGFFEEEKDNDLRISAAVYFGDSGGPVLNMDGKLIGITKQMNEDDVIALAVPTSAIIDLYSTFERVEICSIYNNTELPIKYEIKWNEDGNWKEEEPIEPKKEKLHPWLSKNISTEYPKIRFEDSQNGNESSESIQKKLDTKYRFFGIGIVKDFDSHIESNDSLRYQFMSDPNTKNISLVKLKRIETFMVNNNTKSLIFFQYRWNEDGNWEKAHIRPGVMWKDGEDSEKISRGYPRIRFDKIEGDEEYPIKNMSSLTLLTQTVYRDKTEPTAVSEGVKQMGWSPPLYYQFNNNNMETNQISLEELQHTQRFKIQNPTEVVIYFTYKWHENDRWELGYIRPNETKVYPQQSELVSVDYPKINYSENVIPVANKLRSYVGDNISTQNIQGLETEIGYYNKKNDEFTPNQYQDQPHGYHFEYNSKTQKLSFDEGLFAINNKSTRWSFDFVFFVVGGVLLLVSVLVLAIVLSYIQRHIFSIQNKTETAVNYSVKWTKKDDREQETLEPGDSYVEWWTGILKKKPQIQFDREEPILFETDPVEETDPEAIVTTVETMTAKLKTKTRHIRPNLIDTISQKNAYKYHFDYDPETNELNLYDSNLKQKVELHSFIK